MVSIRACYVYSCNRYHTAITAGIAKMAKISQWKIWDYDYNTQTFTASSYSATTAVIELTFQLEGYGGVPLVFVERVTI